MVSPMLFHLVVNTSNYEAMKRWYLNVLEQEGTSNLGPQARASCGLMKITIGWVCSMLPKLMTPSRWRRPVFNGARGSSEPYAFDTQHCRNCSKRTSDLSSLGNSLGMLHYGPTMSMYYETRTRTLSSCSTTKPH